MDPSRENWRAASILPRASDSSSFEERNGLSGVVEDVPVAVHLHRFEELLHRRGDVGQHGLAALVADPSGQGGQEPEDRRTCRTHSMVIVVLHLLRWHGAGAVYTRPRTGGDDDVHDQTTSEPRKEG
jgi:hypothetical protein